MAVYVKKYLPTFLSRGSEIVLSANSGKTSFQRTQILLMEILQMDICLWKMSKHAFDQKWKASCRRGKKIYFLAFRTTRFVRSTGYCIYLLNYETPIVVYTAIMCVLFAFDPRWLVKVKGMYAAL